MSKAMTAACCALVLAALPLNAAQNNKNANRFAAMDRNGDGVITRAEWNGSDRSFRVHDWNGDGVLSGAEVTPGARRPQTAGQDGPTFDSANRDYEFDDWTQRGFDGLDHNRDGRLTADEWHFNREGFRRADHNGDGVVTRAEFLGEDSYGDNIDDRVALMDTNHDGRVTRQEWHGTREAFDRLDGNRDGILSGTEMHRSRDEFPSASHSQSRAYQAGFERGRIEGLQAGREDKERNQGWDLEGQRELETADSGYTQAVGARDEYQAGYRDGFRPAYREGFANAR